MGTMHQPYSAMLQGVGMKLFTLNSYFVPQSGTERIPQLLETSVNRNVISGISLLVFVEYQNYCESKHAKLNLPHSEQHDYRGADNSPDHRE